MRMRGSPEILKSKLKQVVGCQNKSPEKEQFHVHQGAACICHWYFCIFSIFHIVVFLQEKAQFHTNRGASVTCH